MLKQYLPEAKEALQQLNKVSSTYEHRIGVLQDYIDDLQRTLEVLNAEHEEVDEMIRSLDYDIDCVINEEPPSGYHIMEIRDEEFNMPAEVQCDCTICRLDAINKRFSQE